MDTIKITGVLKRGEDKDALLAFVGKTYEDFFVIGNDQLRLAVTEPVIVRYIGFTPLAMETTLGMADGSWLVIRLDQFYGTPNTGDIVALLDMVDVFDVNVGNECLTKKIVISEGWMQW